MQCVPQAFQLGQWKDGDWFMVGASHYQGVPICFKSVEKGRWIGLKCCEFDHRHGARLLYGQDTG
jgi:hypothetical protein